MTVYIDDMRRPARVGRVRGVWSHLLADSPEELHEFAARLGLARSWVQCEGTPLEHYDVTDTKRQQALALGARPVSYLRDVPAFLMAKRDRMKADRVAGAAGAADTTAVEQRG